MPTTLEDFTADWFNTNCDLGGARVSATRVTQIGEGVGLLGILARVELDRAVDQLVGCQPADAHAVMRAAADLHSKYWANEALDALTWLPKTNDPIYKAAQPEYNKVYDLFLERYGDRLSPYGLNVASEMRFKTNAVQDDAVNRGPMTLAHYDLRLDNIMFGDDDGVYLIDWQLSAQHLGAFDVGYFIGWSMTDDVRRAITPALIGTYHEALLSHGVSGYSRQQCEDDVRGALLGVALMAAYGSVATVAVNERGQALQDALVERAFATCEDLQAADFLPA